MNAAWEPTLGRHHCVNLQAYLLGTSILNFLIDVAILVFPLPMIWRLMTLSRKRKAALTCIFCLGALYAQPAKTPAIQHPQG